MSRDPYRILGVDVEATDAQIKSAYHKLAREHHPDHAGAENATAFQDVTWAWNLLKDETKRQEFDKQRSTRKSPPGSSEEVSIGPLPRRGEDLHTDVHISFQEAYTGTQVKLVVNQERVCEFCKGSGSEVGHIPYPCTECQGRGFHEVGRMKQMCQRCHGRGMIVEVPCKHCKEGITIRPETYQVNVPAGTHPGDSVIIEGQGRPGWSQNGDLVVKVHVAESQVYRYGPEAGDITIEVPIHWSESVLGGSVVVPAPTGPMRIQLPAGTPSGKRFRIRDQGLNRPDGTKGHLYAQMVIFVPDEPSPEQRRLIASLRAWEDNEIRQVIIDQAGNEWGWN